LLEDVHEGRVSARDLLAEVIRILLIRLRINYLAAYQALVLAEPDSAVSQPLKEAFLALRQAAEADE
jgi:hypothetical protein